jgi:hypothetical protein
MNALLLVPSSVAGGAPGKTANSAGTRINPPSPTIESTKPASSEAPVTTSISMAGLSHPICYRNSSYKRLLGEGIRLSCAPQKAAGATQTGIKKAPTSGAFKLKPGISYGALEAFFLFGGFVSSDPRQHEQGPFASAQTLGGAPRQCIGNYPLCLASEALLANQSVSGS